MVMEYWNEQLKNGIIVYAVVLFFAGCKDPVTDVKILPVPSAGDSLVWQDEFNGAALDLSKWNYETGTGVNGDFGTGQIDRATDRKENVDIVAGISKADGGCLAITTRKENYIDRSYTSGRLTTSGKGAWGPGHTITARIWARDVTAKGQGFALWMMPAEKPAGQSFIMWPQGGEVDIMEYVGSMPRHNLGSVHYAWSWENNQYAEWNHGHKGAYYSYLSNDVPVTAPSFETFIPQPADSILGNGSFHIYSIRWLSDRMEFAVDQQVYHIHYFKDGAAFDGGIADGQDKDGIRVVGGKRTFLSEYSNHFPEWHPFEHSMFIILSAGVGGSDSRTYGGAVIPEAKFPCTVLVDWIRIYKNSN